MSTQHEDLEREAADVRERLRMRVEELDRISAQRLDVAREERSSSESGVRPAPAAAKDEKDEDVPPERKRLERRADRVRERLADSVEALQAKAREQLLPIAVAGGALVLLFTAAFAWTFYKTVKVSRRLGV